MKLCPHCNTNYSDQTLEFCLEDGTRLVSTNRSRTETPTMTIPGELKIANQDTFNLPSPNQPETVAFQGAKNLQPTIETNLIKDKSIVGSYRILEISSITISLTHNWWQWLYLNNQYYSSFSTYVLSANFLMWLLLLAAGTGVGVYTLKQSQNKIIPITSLVLIAINLLLFLVPKR